MNIAMVFDGLQIGGIERVGADYAHMLRMLGHNVAVFNLSPSREEMKSEFPKDCKFYNLYLPRAWTPERYASIIRRNEICKFAYPILSLLLNVINLGYSLLCKVKQEFRTNYDIAIAFSGHFNDLTFVSRGYIRSGKKMCWLHGGLYGYALMSDGYLNEYRRIKNLVVLNDFAQNEVLRYNQKLNIRINKLYNPCVIGNKIIDEKYVEKLKGDYGDFSLMVGRLDKDKDHKNLIDAFIFLREKYNFRKKLVLVGDGATKQELVNYVKNQDMEDSIIFEGNRIDVQNYYRAATLFVHSSPLEGLPTTLVESLYFGLPIVATDSIPGVREILGNSEYGVVVPVSDCRNMGEAIYNMYVNEKMYGEYKTRCANRFGLFDEVTIRNKLEKILSDVVNGEM